MNLLFCNTEVNKRKLSISMSKELLMNNVYYEKLSFPVSVSGMDDGSGDLVGTEVDTEFNFISLQSILAFLMGFGWIKI